MNKDRAKVNEKDRVTVNKKDTGKENENIVRHTAIR